MRLVRVQFFWCHIRWVLVHRGEQLLCISLHPQTKHYPGDRSLAYDLIVKRGIVSGRVALLLRSTEIKPDAFLRSVFYFYFLFFIHKVLHDGQCIFRFMI